MMSMKFAEMMVKPIKTLQWLYALKPKSLTMVFVINSACVKTLMNLSAVIMEELLKMRIV